MKQPFAADSGDSCGATKGVLAWYPKPRVDVDGELHDTLCGGDGRFSTATFTAYAGGQRVDGGQIRANDGFEKFTFQLTNTVSTAPIERVTVQVCRSPLGVGLPAYCGPLKAFRTPRAES